MIIILFYIADLQYVNSINHYGTATVIFNQFLERLEK